MSGPYAHCQSWAQLQREIPGNVGGWQGDAERDRLFDVFKTKLGPGKLYVEIGVYSGAIISMAAALSGAKCYAIDPFTNDTEWKLHGRHLRDVYNENIAANGVGEFVTTMAVMSDTAARVWDLPIHVLLIDGDHSFAAARADLGNFAPWVVSGGILLMHDCYYVNDDPSRKSEPWLALDHWMGSEPEGKWRLLHQYEQPNATNGMTVTLERA